MKTATHPLIVQLFFPANVTVEQATVIANAWEVRLEAKRSSFARVPGSGHLFCNILERWFFNVPPCFVTAGSKSNG
jgi:hypothetical protein